MAKKKLKLKVLFDTNVVYNTSASDLLRKETVELIRNNSNLADIDIEWLLPEVVVKERTFQMIKKGNELLGPIQKLEAVLGHNLNITKEVLESRIVENVKKQIESLSINVIKVDTTKVDWNTLIDDSLFRRAPFEDNEKEKGFRDALILECLKLTIGASPTTKSICRIVLVTNDGRLNEAAVKLIGKHTNIDLFTNSGDFLSLINILSSEITEELVKQISSSASQLFFEKENKSSLYFSSNIRDQVSSKFKKELNLILEGAETRENGSWWINGPKFERKEKQRIFWRSIIEVDFICYKHSTYPVSGIGSERSQWYSSSLPPVIGTGFINPAISPLNPESFLQSSARFSFKDKVAGGKTRFEVLWSVTLTTNKKLKTPKVEEIKFLETVPLS